MTANREPDRLIRAFLLEGEEELHDRVYDAVRAEIEQTRQRAVFGPWRILTMKRFMAIGAAAVAVLVMVVIGAQVFGSPSNVGGGDDATPTPEPIATQQPTPEATPSATPRSGLPDGPFVVTGADDPVRITVDIRSAGWEWLPQFDAVSKDDDGLDAPDTVGGALLAWGWPAGTAFHVYGDACQWSTTLPEAPATTPDEIAAALTAQAQTEATDPVDVTVGGYAGKAITLSVPMSYDLPNATRDEKFAECDDAALLFYGVEGAGPDAGESTGEARGAQGAGQIDELWILDVDGSIVILDAAYGPATPPDLVEELRALAESASFETP